MPLLTTRKFLAEVVSIVERELEHLGFRKVSGAYTFRLNDDAHGWLGLNAIAQRSDGRVGLNPVVGVVNTRIETRLQDLTGDVESRPSPTISTSLGYVSPETRYQEWLFEPAPFDYQTEVTRMVSAIEHYGIPFMRSNATLEEITRDLENVRFTSKDSVIYRLPIAFAISGRVDLGVARVREQFAAIANRTDLDARRYKTFASGFLAEFT